MTRKHFEAIAAAFAAARAALDCDPAGIDGIAEAERNVADACLILNPRFDRERFLKACNAPARCVTCDDTATRRDGEDRPVCGDCDGD